MICKKCGFEYVDGLKECPNCQAPNVPEEATVLSEEERDTFDGITIENAGDTDQEEFRVYDKEESQQAEEEEQPRTGKIFTLGGTSMIWTIFLILIILGILLLTLSFLAPVFLIAVACYYLYVWLF